MTAYRPTATSKPRAVPESVEYGRLVRVVRGVGPGVWLNSTDVGGGGTAYGRVERTGPTAWTVEWS
eukprot:CAMPEP_0182461128 /NCGR_PEP_ID=MMETSP1319-20130603/5784_1 /TAXON_ID=172717 /ORGANISM="Bolidomonas pacifica, Strain RCC208" /LENGTH=65 /DNA_ID=CAMNT_0024660351 /DNA_START=489 /DNA_END=683 /DNA_ORIENTATION=-